MIIPKVCLAALTVSHAVHSASVSRYPIRLETRTQLNTRAANIHITVDDDAAVAAAGVVSFTYGSCSDRGPLDAHHTIISSGHASPGSFTDRLVWLIPEDAPASGCLSAWGPGASLLGRSEPQQLSPRRGRKRSVAEVHERTLRRRARRSGDDGGSYAIDMSEANGIDAWGPWFDGVELLEGMNLSAVDVGAAKSKKIGIVGAGMGGLMTFLCLKQAGFENLEIIEAGERLGGRVHTEYISGGPFDYSYQEMGPMRFPYTWTSSSNKTYNISDHRLVFQLAQEMNDINNHDANFSVDFIPWQQSSDNGLVYKNGIRLADGMPPTVAQVNANSSLSVQTVYDTSTQDLQDQVDSVTSDDDFYAHIATNMFEAHRDFIESGPDGLAGEHWSEFAYMVNYLKANLNDTDIVSGGSGDSSFWNSWYDGLYFSAATWKTIDGGLSRLPSSFHPLVDNHTTMGRKIERVHWDAETDQVSLLWRDNYTETTFQNDTYDYAVVAVPFTVLKKWRLPEIDLTMSNAISNMKYGYACKVALEFETRFWEHYANPIYGSCSTETDIPGIGSICYPSYNINGTGPATMLGSYISESEWGMRWASVPEEEHMQYVLQAMIEIHGEVAQEQFTGKYNRRCWVLDPLESGSWANPSVGQHELYLPEYFKTHKNMIFVGEHTSYTHAWIASALESGIRGSVQLMLELGLVDEAKSTVEKWMARWIEI